jgi:hypothetical protein
MKESFSDVIQGMDAPVEEEDLKKLILAHDKAHDGNVDYNDFLSAKKWVNKNYLTAFRHSFMASLLSLSLAIFFGTSPSLFFGLGLQPVNNE